MLTDEFILLCKEYAKTKTDLLNESFDDSDKICSCVLEFYGYILELRYVKKSSAFIKPSSLYCVIKLRKNSVIHYHLTDIIPFLEYKSFKSCYFGIIESAERLKSCFESLVSVIESVTSQLSRLQSNDSAVLQALFDSYKTIYGLKEKDLDFDKIENPSDYAQVYFLSLQKMRDGFIFSRYSDFAPYSLLIENKVDKALKKYEKLRKKDRLLPYEKQLIDYIANSENSGFTPLDPECDTAFSQKLAAPLSLIKAFALVFCAAACLFCGFFAVYNLIISNNTLTVLSAPWYEGFIFAAFCAIFGACVFFPHMPNKRLNKRERKNFYDVLVSKGARRFTFICFIASVLISLVLSLLIMRANVKLYDDKITFGSKSYGYNDIYAVYRIDARYNRYGDRIDRPSYVILFDDETSLDLDGYASVKATEKEVLPILEKNGFTVKTAESEKELPWYTDE